MGFLFKALTALGIGLFLMFTSKLLKLPRIEIFDDSINWFTQTLNTSYNIQSILQFISCFTMQFLLLNLLSSLCIDIDIVDSTVLYIISILICIIIGICAQLFLKFKFPNS